MSWQFTLFILIIINICSITLVKIVSERVSKKSLGVFYQYLFCAIIATLYFLFFGNGDIGLAITLILGIGFLVGFGNYFQWRASELSLSKTALFFPLIQIIPITLAIIFLGEANLWNLKLISGVGLSFLAIWIFQASGGEKNKRKEILNKKWFFFTGFMIIIFGLTDFLAKLFSFTLPREVFLMGWYNGAFLSSLVILALEKQKIVKIPLKTIFLILFLSISISATVFFLYWTYQLGGQIGLVVPLRYLFITLIPVTLGWFIFKERKGLSKIEWLGFLTGIAGAALILLS